LRSPCTRTATAAKLFARSTVTHPQKLQTMRIVPKPCAQSGTCDHPNRRIECVLGSLWGLLGLIPFFALIVARTLGEEAVLREGLAGYPDYTRKVRFRLLPGVW